MQSDYCKKNCKPSVFEANFQENHIFPYFWLDFSQFSFEVPKFSYFWKFQNPLLPNISLLIYLGAKSLHNYIPPPPAIFSFLFHTHICISYFELSPIWKSSTSFQKTPLAFHSLSLTASVKIDNNTTKIIKCINFLFHRI